MTRSGAALLEVIVALTILAISGVTAVALVSGAVRSVTAAREAEMELRRASAFLEAVTLWTRDDLDRRLGERPQGPWRLRIDRPSETLYTAVLIDRVSGHQVLSTSLHRSLPTNE